jgi:hypothetical protein
LDFYYRGARHTNKKSILASWIFDMALPQVIYDGCYFRCHDLIVIHRAGLVAMPLGFVEGQLKIIELEEVDLAGWAGSRPSKPIAETTLNIR